MNTCQKPVLVEIVARKKGCMLCNLAIGILEEISAEFDEGQITWEVVDLSDRVGLLRYDELTSTCGRQPKVPSIIINNKIAFDQIPDMQSFTEAVNLASK